MPLAGPPEEYFHPELQGFLKLWMIQAEEAIAVRQAAIRELAHPTRPQKVSRFSAESVF
jgi:hypothetical protein